MQSCSFDKGKMGDSGVISFPQTVTKPGIIISSSPPLLQKNKGCNIAFLVEEPVSPDKPISISSGCRALIFIFIHVIFCRIKERLYRQISWYFFLSGDMQCKIVSLKCKKWPNLWGAVNIRRLQYKL